MSTTLTFTPSAAVARIEQTSRRVQQPQSTGELVSLAMGEPNFDTPPQIVEAGVRAIRDGHTHYSDLKGEPVLRHGLAEALEARVGLPIDARDVIVTHGGTGGLAASILGIVDPGDTVVLPDPTYSLYADLVSMAGGRAVHVPLGDDLHWDMDALADALAGARLFVFCNPSNPTGIVHNRVELEALGQLLDSSDTLVLADEAYADLVYTDEPFVSALQVDSLAHRTIYCQTFSKSYAMTGWRIGYLWGPRPAIDVAARVHATFNGSPNTFVQYAALEALRTGAADVARMRTAYLRRRQLMADGLRDVPGLQTSSPEGAFYLFPKYDAALDSATMVARLREFGVAVRPGAEFGEHGERHLRLSYAAGEEAIRTGVQRLAAGMAAIRSAQR
jgi:aspartate aminotransferase